MNRLPIADRAKIVGLSDAKHTTLMRNMIVHNPNLRYELLLNGKSLDVLAAIHLLNLCTVKEIEQLKKIYGLTLKASDSHQLKEKHR